MDALAVERPGGAGGQETGLDIAVAGMTCASCVRRVERALLRVPGVTAAEVNLATERAHVSAGDAASLDALLAAVEQAGYHAAPVVPDAPPGEEAALAAARSRRELLQVVLAAALSAPLLLGMLAHLLGLPWMLPGWAQFALATPVQFWLGARFYAAGWKAVRAGSGNMDLLVALGTSAAWGLSTYALMAGRCRSGGPGVSRRSTSNPRR